MLNESTDIDVNKLCADIQKAVVTATKHSAAFGPSQFNFYSNYNQFSKMMRHEENVSLNLLSQMIQNEHKVTNNLEKVTDDDDKFDVICQLNDVMLDSIANSLDEAEGLKNKDAALVMATLNNRKKVTVTNAPSASWNRVNKGKHWGEFHLLAAKTIQRPQTKFKDKISNSNSPFIPKISYKPNSIKPLAILPEIDDDGVESYSHPYEVEIEKFEPSEYFLQIAIPSLPKPIEQSPFKFIETQKDLEELCDELKQCKEIAIDLEHHSYRTFQGFTCLMQISTRTMDYVIDALELRDEMHVLNEVFTSPSILKIFHGADMDIYWLQRDFGLYIVNMFDTGHAAKLLNFSHLSLSFLLKHYCNIEANKQFQLADWRMRPLLEEMIKYAREDTHYLIFIYEQMKSELIAKGNFTKNLLKSVFNRGKALCLKKYEKPIFKPDNYKFLLKKSKTIFNPKQEYALKELFAWRDRIARNEDESIGYVLPNHMLIKIAEVLPREHQGVLSCCNPIPPLVKQQLNEFHLIILKARDLVLDKPNETFHQSSHHNRPNRGVLDLDDSLISRHDTAHLDTEQNLPCLLDDGGEHLPHKTPSVKFNSNSSLIYRLFSQKSEDNSKKKLSEKTIFNFVSPFERYKTAKEKIYQQMLEENANNANTTNTTNTNNQSQVNVKDSVSRIYSHFLELKSKSDNIIASNPESIDTEISNNIVASNPESVDAEMTVCDSVLEEKRFENPKQKKNKKLRPDIPCNSVASLQYKLEQRSKNVNIDAQSSSVETVEPFDYCSYDYSNFSANKSTSEASHNKPKRRFNTKNRNFKRKADKSFTYSHSKR